MTSLERLLKVVGSKDCAPFDLIAVTGDIGDRLDEHGLKYFKERLYPLLQTQTASPESLAIVPGNHDVRWKLPTESSSYFDDKFEAFRGVLDHIKSRGGAAISCLLPAGGLVADEEIRYEGGSPLRINDTGLLTLCINSAIRSGELHRRGEKVDVFDIAHVTQSQRNLLSDIIQRKKEEYEAQLNKREGDGPEQRGTNSTRVKPWDALFKVALLHHHPLPFSGQITEHKPFEGLVDAGLVLDLLREFGFHLILSGHKHQPYVQPINFGRGDILFVGGPTVAGNPVQGDRGFFIIEVSSGNPTGFDIKVAKVNLEEHAVPTKYICECLDRAEELHLSPPPPKTLGHKGSVRLCAEAEHAYREISQFTPSTNKDSSNRYILLCQSHRPNEVSDVLKQLYPVIRKKGVMIEGIYDVFGKEDLVVKLQAKKRLLVEQNLVVKVRDLLRGYSLTDVSHEFLPTATEQIHFRAGRLSRGIKAFVHFEGPHASKELDELAQLCTGIRNDPKCFHPVLLNQLYRLSLPQDYALMAEFSVGCGGFYDVARAIITIEKALTKLKKTTLLAMTVWENGKEF